MRFRMLLLFLLMVNTTTAFEAQTQIPVATDQLQSNSPDTTAGLQELLMAAISAARADHQAAVDKIVQGMQIPDYQQWFLQTEAHSESWAKAYGAQVASPTFGVSLKCRFREFARRQGTVTVQRINDGPNQPNGFADGWLRNLLKPINIYEAKWSDEGAGVGAKPQWIGYFVYTDDAFRWYSIVRHSTLDMPRAFMPAHTSEARYPYPPDGTHPGGFVHLTLLVREDGSVEDVKPNGAVESTSDENLIKAGIDAVRQFRLLQVGDKAHRPVRIDDLRIMVCPREAI